MRMVETLFFLFWIYSSELFLSMLLVLAVSPSNFEQRLRNETNLWTNDIDSVAENMYLQMWSSEDKVLSYVGIIQYHNP